MAEYRLTPAAEQDLEQIWIYTQQQWCTSQADDYTNILTTAFSELALSPKTAPACDYIRPGYRRRGIGRYVIYFRITEYGIAMICILHERMDTTHRL